MIAIKTQGIVRREDGYIISTQNKEGLLNIFIEPQDVRYVIKNYIILCDEIAKYILDIDHIYIPSTYTLQDIVETVEKLSEVRS